MVPKYWSNHSEIHEAEGFIFVGQKLLIPESLRLVWLKVVHGTHLGIEKCKFRAHPVMYWPGMSQDIEDTVYKCTTCKKFSGNNHKEALIPHEIPDRPWAKIGTDLFQFGNEDYLIEVDYESKYPEVLKLNNKRAKEVVSKLKDGYTIHGIPDQMVADNIPYNSQEMMQFAKEWGVKITTSSPTYAQSNCFSRKICADCEAINKKGI